MSSNRAVNDEEILVGFASLHGALASGFDELRRQILDVRNDVSRLEQRMLRRFDDLDERLDRHEERIAALEARA